MKEELVEYLLSFMSIERASTFREVIQHRTNYVTVVLEDIYQSQNASAVLRTCDCFGLQEVHIIENNNPFDINPRVVRGATKWIDLFHYKESNNNSLDAILKLKSQGYRIIATTPHSNDINLESFDVSKGKFALFFGNEHDGISSVVRENADEFLRIPMYGFTESFNISVSVAIILHHLVYSLRQNNFNYTLPEQEKIELMLRWLNKTVKGSEIIVREFMQKNKMGDNFLLLNK